MTATLLRRDIVATETITTTAAALAAYLASFPPPDPENLGDGDEVSGPPVAVHDSLARTWLAYLDEHARVLAHTVLDDRPHRTLLAALPGPLTVWFPQLLPATPDAAKLAGAPTTPAWRALTVTAAELRIGDWASLDGFSWSGIANVTHYGRRNLDDARWPVGVSTGIYQELLNTAAVRVERRLPIVAVPAATLTAAGPAGLTAEIATAPPARPATPLALWAYDRLGLTWTSRTGQQLVTGYDPEVLRNTVELDSSYRGLLTVWQPSRAPASVQ